jgi:autophagy-related protein 13
LAQTAIWRTLKIEDGTPPPLTFEVYLDLNELTKSQTLVILDENGKRHNVAEALYPAMPSNARPYAKRPDRIVLERWRFSIKDELPAEPSRDHSTLSNVYKKCIPVFRSLVTFVKMMPTAKYLRGVSKSSSTGSSNPALKLRFRILHTLALTTANDSLGCALYPDQRNVTETYSFGTLESPAGELHASVTYRTNCDFRVDDSEAILSSHFMAMDDHYFKPSLGRNDTNSQVVGSAPTAKQDFSREEEPDQTYGSLSTFHTLGPKPSTSPISALRAVADAGGSSPGSIPNKSLPINRLSQGSKTTQRSGDPNPVFQRRPSVSFQPFKAGSLASSPASGMMACPVSPGAAGRTIGAASLPHRRGPSLTTLPQAILRTPHLPNEAAVASSTSSSPKPAPINRYSSSFSHRRSRFSSGASKGDEEGSSGKPSPSSSAQPGSDVLNDGRGESGGSDSVQKSDDDNIKDFLGLLESRKDLKSFSRSDAASQNASMRRTTAALAKYRQMTQSTRDLSDSLSSSLLKGSSSSSSRQLHNVPPMVGASVSTGSSPGKPISPHTPAVPSRLSAVAYGEPRRSRSRPRNREHEVDTTSRDEDSSETTTGRGESTAIPIPTSPRPWAYGRRSSSVSQRQHSRALDDDEDTGFGVNRPASLPTVDDRSLDIQRFRLADDVTPPLDPEQTAADDDLPPTGASSRSEDDKQTDEPSSEEQLPIYPFRQSNSQRRVYSVTPDPTPFGHHARPRGSHSSLGATAHSSRLQSYSPSSSGQGSSSLTNRGAGSDRRGHVRSTAGSRSSATAAQDDDEFGIFGPMSELGGRKSLEDARGDKRGGARDRT